MRNHSSSLNSETIIMEFYCNKCNHKLTQNPLKISSKKELDYSDEEDLLKPGTYISVTETTFNFDINIEYLISFDSIILNDHKENFKLQGCCGPSNFNTLNQVCPKCNHEIGVLIADCWTPCFIGIDATKIAKKPLW